MTPAAFAPSVAIPHRIQRLRTKGWRMPHNAVYVGRPTIWGNPYDVRVYGVDLSMRLFRETASGCWNPDILTHSLYEFIQHSYKKHCAWLKRLNGQPTEMIISHLRGKNLCCWCALDRACHADVLLEIANRGGR